MKNGLGNFDVDPSEKLFLRAALQLNNDIQNALLKEGKMIIDKEVEDILPRLKEESDESLKRAVIHYAGSAHKGRFRVPYTYCLIQEIKKRGLVN